MLKKILKKIKNIKVVHRFFISYSVLIMIVISSWIFSYTTIKQLQNNLQNTNSNISSQLLISDKIEQITIYLVIVVILIIGITILLLVFMHYNITNPVSQLAEAAENFGRGKLVTVDIDSQDELGLLSTAFNKMVVDITATQKALQDELAKTKEIDEQKSEFLSIAAHQLRTPMSGLKWLFNLTLSGDIGCLTEKQEKLLKSGAENVDRMIRLINDFLDIAKIEQAKFQYKFELIAIHEIINDVVKSLETKLKLKKINFTIQKKGIIPLVQIDKEKMKIAFTNLIDNAIKYSPAKSKITTNITTDKQYLKITVQDQGYGIPEKDKKLIFTKFFRGSNVLKKETNLETIGTGLGLFIVKDIITKHDGNISFQSEENKGTSFYINLPIK